MAPQFCNTDEGLLSIYLQTCKKVLCAELLSAFPVVMTTKWIYVQIVTSNRTELIFEAPTKGVCCGWQASRKIWVFRNICLHTDKLIIQWHNQKRAMGVVIGTTTEKHKKKKSSLQTVFFRSYSKYWNKRSHFKTWSSFLHNLWWLKGAYCGDVHLQQLIVPGIYPEELLCPTVRAWSGAAVVHA